MCVRTARLPSCCTSGPDGLNERERARQVELAAALKRVLSDPDCLRRARPRKGPLPRTAGAHHAGPLQALRGRSLEPAAAAAARGPGSDPPERPNRQSRCTVP